MNGWESSKILRIDIWDIYPDMGKKDAQVERASIIEERKWSD